jgi:AcrR family transcriptional regulator
VTNLGGRSTSAPDPGPSRDARGLRRRAELLAAAVALFADGGWESITTRAVAARAGANPALVHHHFGSVTALRRAAVAAVLATTFEPVAEAVLEAVGRDEAGAVQAVLDAVVAEPAANRTTAELLRAAGHDDAVRAQLRASLRAVRSRVAARLPPDDLRTAALEVVIPALVDGLLLHRLVDPDLDTAPAARLLVELFKPGARS